MRHLASWLALIVACAPGAERTDRTESDRPVGIERAVLPDGTRGASGAAGTGRAAGTGETGGAVGPVGIESVYLDRYDFEAGGQRYDLPGRLDEISGLAMSVDGRLFAHDDERARIYEIDPASGEVGKSFDLGSGEIRDDFEGVAVVGDRFFLVSSSGFLYEFGEGADSEDVGYRATDTGLGAGCEIEGLDHDPSAGALLFACKQTEALADFVVIHRIPVAGDGETPALPPAAPTGAAETLPPVLIPRADLTAFGLDTDFQASAVLATPEGTILLTSAATETIVEVDGVGRVLGGVALSPERHPQAEGLALGPDGSLYVADEENDDDARLTRYTPRGSDDR